jgi:peptide/nickel transport system substrate-binding protein
MTTEDVRYSFLRCLLTDRAGGPSFLLQEPLLGVSTLGKPEPKWYKEAAAAVTIEAGALVLKLKKPHAPLMGILAAFCPVVPKGSGGWDGSEETWAKHWNPGKQDTGLYARAIGTGPFKLERWDRENRQLTLTRHDGYWRRPAMLERVVFKTVPEFSARKLMLQAGDADAVMLERQYLAQVSDLPGVSVIDDLPLLETHNAFILTQKVDKTANPFIGADTPADLLSDLNVRKGLAYSFDYDAYIRDGYRGKGQRARGPIPAGVFGHNPRQPVHERSAEKATAHFKLARGGDVWKNGFKVTCAYMEGRADRQLACQILKKTVEELNPKFQIDVRGLQWPKWLESMALKKLPIASGRWVLDFADPHSAVEAFMGSEGYYAKPSGYSDPRVNRSIEKAKGELDRAARRGHYNDIQAAAFADVPHIFTLDTYHFQVLRSWVKGWTYNPIMLYGYLYPVSKS